MATINFYLWHQSTDGLRPIFLVYQDRGKKFRFYTGEKIDPRFWDEKTQRVKRNARGSIELNLLLQAFEDRLRKYVRQERAEGRMPSVQNVSDFIRPQETDQKDFNRIKLDFLEHKAPYSKEASMKIYRGMFTHLESFFNHLKRKPDLAELNPEFLDSYVSFLYNKKGMTDNTVHKQIGTLRTFVSWANKRGAGIQGDFSEVKVTKREAAKVYLTMEELKNLASCTPDSQRLEHVRDVFIFACVTGLRYSDLAQLAPEHIFTSISINGQPVREIRMNMVKTERVVTIPLNRMALEI
ncbi:MAG: phage integrase SAM-like domain-containing protein, partial [Bacteroidetes bacterium]|nr:phage integrase SAM-like domain-containing protein [Bacteroidota bacterium]